MKKQKINEHNGFKVGDRVKFIAPNFYRSGQIGTIERIKEDVVLREVFLHVKFEGTSHTEGWYPERFEKISSEPYQHPNQKLANEVAEILRKAADEYLTTPNGVLLTLDTFSCSAVYICATEKFNYSAKKVERVCKRFLRSLGVDTACIEQFPSNWTFNKKQETRHAWLYIAAQFAEENPDLVPTYGKKKVKV